MPGTSRSPRRSAARSRNGRVGDEISLRLPAAARRLRITELVTVHQAEGSRRAPATAMEFPSAAARRRRPGPDHARRGRGPDPGRPLPARHRDRHPAGADRPHRGHRSGRRRRRPRAARRGAVEDRRAARAGTAAMQARVGDHAIFFRKAAVEITFEEKKYLVVPQAAILVLLRDDLPDLTSVPSTLSSRARSR